MLKNKNREHRIFYMCVIGFIAVLLFKNLYSIMFAVHDDMRIYTLVRSGNLFSDAVNSAIATGRISHLWNHVLLGIPFLSGQIWVYKLMVYGTFVFDVFALFLLIKKYAGKHTAWLSVLFIFSFATISNQHNLLISYAFCHQLSLGLFLLSFYIYLRYLENNRKRDIIVAGLLLLFSYMIYEMFSFMLLFYALAAFMSIKNKSEGLKFKEYLIKCARCLAVPFLTVVFYVSVYFIFQNLNKPLNAYEGTSLYFAEPIMSLLTIFIYSLGFFPVAQIVKTIVKFNMDLTGLANFITMESVVKSLLASMAGIALFLKIDLKGKEKKILPFALAGIFIPNILIGFTEKYIKLTKNGTIAYITSFYSYFFLTVFLIVVVSIIYKKAAVKKRSNLLLAFLAVMIFGVSLTADVNTNIWAEEFGVQFNKCKSFDAAVSSGLVTGASGGTRLYIPDNFGINGLMTYTEDYVGIYAENDIYCVNEAEKLDFSNKVICMRYNGDGSAMVSGYIDSNLNSKEIYISMSEKNTVRDIFVFLNNGEEYAVRNAYNGQVCVLENELLFDLGAGVV